jgi:hypothetical protein
MPFFLNRSRIRLSYHLKIVDISLPITIWLGVKRL